jgi:transposase
MANYLKRWINQLKWQRLIPFEKLADTLLKHLTGILNYCDTKVRFGVVEAVLGDHPNPAIRDHLKTGQ